MLKFTKNLSLAAVSVAALALSACIGAGSNGVSSNDDGYATVTVQTKTSNINQLGKPGLGKSSTITLDSLYVTAISNAATPDTVNVMLAVGDSGFSATATNDQNIAITLTLKALRNWTITARTVDVNDSVVQSGSVVTGNLFAGQNKLVTLTAKPRYKIYTATFSLPDSIQSPTGLFKQNIKVTKIEMWIKGVKRDDSIGTDLTPGVNTVLTYDYTDTVTSGAGDTLTLKVYGNIDSASAPYNSGSNLLYYRTVALNTLTATYPTANPVALTWKGPVAGVDSLTVAVQKVGQVAINGTTDPIILSKK